VNAFTVPHSKDVFPSFDVMIYYFFSTLLIYSSETVLSQLSVIRGAFFLFRNFPNDLCVLMSSFPQFFVFLAQDPVATPQLFPMVAHDFPEFFSTNVDAGRV